MDGKDKAQIFAIVLIAMFLGISLAALSYPWLEKLAYRKQEKDLEDIINESR